MASFSQGGLVEQVSTIAAAGGTTTLTANSVQVWRVTGTGSQTFRLPQAAGIANPIKVGRSFNFTNHSDDALLIRDYASGFIRYINPGESIKATLMSNSTNEGTWLFEHSGMEPQPLVMSAHPTTPDSKIYFTSEEAHGFDGAGISLPPISSNIPDLPYQSTVDFQTQATAGATFEIAWPGASTLNYYNRVGFSLLTNGTIKGIFATENVSFAALANPGTLFVPGALAIGWIDLKATSTSAQYKTAYSSGSVIENISTTALVRTVHRFGSGGGSGSGSGDANEILERLKNDWTISSYQHLTANVFASDGTDFVHGSSTGSLDLTDNSYQIDSAEQLISTDLLDPDFRALEVDVPQIDFTAIWLLANIDTAASYYASRNGGTNWTAITMSRVGTLTDTYKGSVTFPEASASVLEYAVGTGTPSSTSLNITNRYKISIPFTTTGSNVVKEVTTYLTKTGSPLGILKVSVVRDDGGGTPSTTATDVLVSAQKTISELSAGDNTVALPVSNTVIKAGDYHLVFETDSGYYSSFSSGTHEIKVRFNTGGAGNLKGNDYTNGWNSNISGLGYYILSGRTLDLRVKVVSSAATRKLLGFGVQYGLGDVAIIGRYEAQTFTFTGASNTYSFPVTNFLPNPLTLKVYRPATGQVWMHPEIQINGQTVTFPANAFNLPSEPEIKLIFDQTQGAAVDTSDANATSIATIDNRLTALGSQLDEFKRVALPMINVPNTTIVGRAQIPDLSQDLSVRMGVERIMTQSIQELQTEFGPNGERVFSALNDSLGLIRFVGNWTANTNTGGQNLTGGTNTTDYVEVTFYGTGLNILNNFQGGGWGLSATVDGGAEGGNFTLGTYSSVLGGRNYASNLQANAVSGLTPGLHTVKIRQSSSSSFAVYGFEILNEGLRTTGNISTGSPTLSSLASTTSIAVGQTVSGTGIPAATTVVAISGSTVTMSANATATTTGVTVSFTGGLNIRNGTYYANAKANALSAATYPIYNSGFESGTLGTRGGRVSVYLKSDGTIGKAVTATNASQANLTSADHSNEEIIRVYNPREFGAGRSDDFSYKTATSTVAFTLDDGTTTLVASNIYIQGNGNWYRDSGSSSMTLTFVGTGVDLMVTNGTTGDTHTFTVDGSSIGSQGTFSVGKYKVVSGLPYGTHTLKISCTSSGAAAIFGNFIVYSPKKPTLPAGAVELADYCVMADYVASSTAGLDYVGTGVLRKMGVREVVYTGGWTSPATIAIGTLNHGFDILAPSGAAAWQYTFFGTGFEFPGYMSLNANTLVTIDGATDLSVSNGSYWSGALTLGYWGNVTSFTASTGTFVSGAANFGGVRVSGLNLGLHTVKMSWVSGTQSFRMGSIDIITPIHSPKSNLYADLQNTLPVGSCSLADSRKLQLLPLTTNKAWAQALPTGDSSTSSSAFVPVPGMSLMVKTSGGPLQINYKLHLYHTNVAATGSLQLYLDGIAVGVVFRYNSPGASYEFPATDSFIISVAAGFHKIDLYWKTSAATLNLVGSGAWSQITVKEL